MCAGDFLPPSPLACGWDCTSRSATWRTDLRGFTLTIDQAVEELAGLLGGFDIETEEAVTEILDKLYADAHEDGAVSSNREFDYDDDDYDLEEGE